MKEKLDLSLQSEKLTAQQERTAKILLTIGAVDLRPNEPFRFDSGILSPIYTDCRLLISYPELRKEITDMFLQDIKDTNNPFDVVAGTATGGIPHASWIADRLDLPMIYVRGNVKNHGKENQIEGSLKKDQRAIVIEDLVSTGGSSIITAKAIRNACAKVEHVFSIVTYEMKKAEDNFREHGLKLVSLTNFSTIVKVSIGTGHLENKDRDVVLQWAEDPTSWGKKMGFER